jgi:hypothetical protein
VQRFVSPLHYERRTHEAAAINRRRQGGISPARKQQSTSRTLH